MKNNHEMQIMHYLLNNQTRLKKLLNYFTKLKDNVSNDNQYLINTNYDDIIKSIISTEIYKDLNINQEVSLGMIYNLNVEEYLK